MNNIYLGTRAVLENNMNIYEPNQAFKAGTIFKSLDQPYKNYKMPTLMPTCQKEAVMMEIQKYGIVIHDLDLYLDVYPDDENAIALRRKYYKEYKELIDGYNRMAPPFDLCADEMNKVPFPWSSSKFPWGEE